MTTTKNVFGWVRLVTREGFTRMFEYPQPHPSMIEVPKVPEPCWPDGGNEIVPMERMTFIRRDASVMDDKGRMVTLYHQS